MEHQNIQKMSNEMLIAILDKRVELESTNEAEMIDFIREVQYRRLYLEFGATSMFDFMTRSHYHYAPVVAQRKLDAAKLMQMFPEVKDHIASNRLNLTQLGMLASAQRQKPIAPKKQRELLEMMCGQTVKNTQALLNEFFEIEVKERDKIRIQRDGSVRAEITFSKVEWEILIRAKDVLSHSIPSGELSKVITYLSDFTLSKKDAASLPSREVKPRQSQIVSRAARRYVFQRDKSCRHRDADGRFCESRYQLQVDHIQSKSAGGGNQVENLQLLCGVHNRYKFELE